MAVEIQQVERDYPHRKQIMYAANILRRGGVIIYPTDTIYGLAADILNKEAIARIFKIKNVSKHKLLSFICRDLQHISEWAHIPNRAFRVMKRVVPGPYTFILPVSKGVPRAILEKRKTVGVRVPDSLVSLSLVEELDRPLLSTSVPRGDGLDDFFTDPHELAALFPHDIDLILDAGILPNNPSTIVDFTVDPPEIIRKGAGDINALF